MAGCVRIRGWVQRRNRNTYIHVEDASTEHTDVSCPNSQTYVDALKSGSVYTARGEDGLTSGIIGLQIHPPG